MIDRTLSRVVILVTISMTIATSALAQNGSSDQSMMVGGGLGYVLGLQSGDVPVYLGQTDCGTFSDGSGSGFAGDARLVLPPLFAPGFGLDLRLRFATTNAELTTEPVVPTTIRDSESGQLVTLDREYRLERSMITIGADVLARYDLGPVLLSAGLAIGINAGGELTQSDNILGPGDQSFPGGQTTRSMSTGGAEVSALSIQPLVSLGVPLRIAPGALLIPELTARIGVGSSVSESSWTTTELAFGLGVLFDLATASTPIAPVPGTGR